MSTTTVPNKPSKTSQTGQNQSPKQPQAEQSQKPQPPQAQQAKTSMFNAETIKAKWKQLVSAAKSRWVKLSEDELTKTDGDEQKLTGLVKDRYAISQDDANQQVKSFLAKNSSK